MKLIFTILIGLLVTTTAFSSQTPSDIPTNLISEYASAEQSRNNGRLEESLKIYRSLWDAAPNSFSIAYGYGQLIAMLKLYTESEDILSKALIIGKNTPANLDPSIYNTYGWVLLMNNKYEAALEVFQTALVAPTYEKLESSTRMKLHNNTGYTFMLLDRYEDSLVQFKLAKQLGSTKAEQNIEKVNSLILTKTENDPNLPGVFTVVVGSARYQDRIESVLAEKSKQIGVETSTLEVYSGEANRFFIVNGRNLSYQRALETKQQMVAKGVQDAFVSSTTNWTPLTVESSKNPDQPQHQQQ